MLSLYCCSYKINHPLLFMSTSSCLYFHYCSQDCIGNYTITSLLGAAPLKILPIVLSIYSLIQQIFTERILYTEHFSMGETGEQDRHWPCFSGDCILVGGLNHLTNKWKYRTVIATQKGEIGGRGWLCLTVGRWVEKASGGTWLLGGDLAVQKGHPGRGRSSPKAQRRICLACVRNRRLRRHSGESGTGQGDAGAQGQGGAWALSAMRSDCCRRRNAERCPYWRVTACCVQDGLGTSTWGSSGGPGIWQKNSRIETGRGTGVVVGTPSIAAFWTWVTCW